MKLMKRRTCLFLVMVWAMACCGNAAGEQGRNPFGKPVKKRSPYNYGSAFRHLDLKGILCFEDTGRCIVGVGTAGRMSVLGPGDEVKVRLYGVDHTFGVSDIREKTVMFKGKNGYAYKAVIQ